MLVPNRLSASVVARKHKQQQKNPDIRLSRSHRKAAITQLLCETVMISTVYSEWR